MGVSFANTSDVIIQAEDTKSSLGKWKLEKEIEGYNGNGYLVFTGNKPANGPATSPLKYKFTVKESGLYYLHIFCAKEIVTIKGEERTDVSNDCYVKVSGDFEAAENAGEEGNEFATFKELKEDHKFFGGNPLKFAWAFGKRLDIGGDRHKKIAAYQLKKDEVYTLTVSGRSQKFKIDQFKFTTSGKSKGKRKKVKKK